MDLNQQELFEDTIDKRMRDKAMLYEKAISPFLTRLEKMFVEARKGQKLCTYKQKKALAKLLDIILKAHADAGLRVMGHSKSHQQDILNGIALTTYGQLMDEYPNVTIEEVKLALTNGIRHAYGNYHGISAETICEFIEKFCKDPDRIEALKKQNRYINSLVEKPVIPQRSEEEIGENCLKVLIDRYKTTGILIDPGHIAYDYAMKKGMIPLTEDQKTAIYEQAVFEADKEEAEDAIKFGRNKFQKTSEKDMQFNYKCKAMDITMRNYCDYTFLIRDGKLTGDYDLSVPADEHVRNQATLKHSASGTEP